MKMLEALSNAKLGQNRNHQLSDNLEISKIFNSSSGAVGCCRNAITLGLKQILTEQLKKLNVSELGGSLLQLAIEKGDEDIFEELLKKGCSLRDPPKAITRGECETTKAEYRYSPFSMQVVQNPTSRKQLLEKILQSGGQPEDSGFTAFSRTKIQLHTNLLGACCYHNRIEFAIFLLQTFDNDELGLNYPAIEYKDSTDPNKLVRVTKNKELDGATPAMIAVYQYGDRAENVIKSLYRKGALFTQTDNSGNSIVHYCAAKNAFRIFNYLKDNVNGLDILQRN